MLVHILLLLLYSVQLHAAKLPVTSYVEPTPVAGDVDYAPLTSYGVPTPPLGYLPPDGTSSVTITNTLTATECLTKDT